MEIKLCSSKLSTTFVIFFIIVSTCINLSECYRKSVAPLTHDEICRQFSVGNHVLQEFYTPLYPDPYPNETECILQISAEFGYLIRVDFRDYFELEPSDNCENDFLEIRDGPHGYSDLMGRFCGSEFPRIITTKDRHVWMRFHSDDILEYKGFRAVFDFIKNTQINRPEIDPCKFEMSGSHGTLSNLDIPEFRFNYSTTYSVALDCTWYIEVKPSQKIYLFFEEFKLAEPNECIMNFVDIYGEERDLRSRMKHYCGSVADPVITSGNRLYFRFFAIKEAINSEFKAWFTAYRDRMNDGSRHCEADEYDCDDATCIDKNLECNGITNCRNEYDEEGCNEDTKKKFDISSEHIIIILTLGCGLLAGMCFAMCFNCIKKLVHDGRQIHENIRRSREQLEDRRSTSMGSSPQLEEAYCAEGKSNGHTCLPPEEDTEEEEEEDDEEEEEDDSCVEMRDCECQTRGGDSSGRDSGVNGTPPPPPPPSRRPPGLPPPHSPYLSVPTPPPPPGSHSSNYYGGGQPHPHHRYPPPPPHQGGPSSAYNSQPPSAPSLHYSDHYELGNSAEPHKHKHRAEAMIQMREKQRYEPSSKSEKTTPDVLVTH